MPIRLQVPASGTAVLMRRAALTDHPATPRPRKSGHVTPGYRWAVVSRCLAALFGGYILAALTSVCVTQWAPMPRADAVLSGMMLSFLSLLAATIWCFACRTAWRAWCGLLLPGMLLGVLFGLGRWLS
jgi:hypothetical protein